MIIESLGTRALFLIPSVKVYGKKYSKSGAVATKIHTFLSQTFGGYTCASGNIYGYFMGVDDPFAYDEHREFRVAFVDDEAGTKLTNLQEFLAELAADIGEECIYLEVGGAALLVYPDPVEKQADSRTTLNPDELAFVNFISDNRSVTTDELISWSRQSAQEVDSFLRQLSERGFIQQIDGFWRVS